MYGLTKGQFSATADIGSKLKTGGVNDLPAMEIVGVAAAPAGSHPSVLLRAAFIAKHAGGNGAVRELLDAVISARPPAVLGAQ